MKKLNVVCLKTDRSDAMEELANLGSIHVDHVQTPASETLDALHHERDLAERALLMLKARPHHAKIVEPKEQHEIATVVDQVLSIRDDVAKAKEKEAALGRAEAQLEPWGSFEPTLIKKLRENGWRTILGTALEDKMPELPEDGHLQVISRQENRIFFAAIVPEDAELSVSEIPLPEITDMKQIRQEEAEFMEQLEQSEKKLDELAPFTDAVEEAYEELDRRVAFIEAQEGMGHEGALCYLSGYIPVKNLETLEASAKQHGWALLTSDPDEDDLKVPTLLSIPKAFKIAKPIFDFIGILPGYFEADVSISVLVFLTIFFGMIVGDAGYGIIFLVLGLFGKMKVAEENKKAKVSLNLFLIFSIITVAWGWMNGNFFAIPQEKLPSFMQGVDWLTNMEEKDRHIQWLCFLIGAIHLSMARIWQAAIKINSKGAAGEIGWALLVWANFFMAVELIVYKNSFPVYGWWLYGIGAALVILFGVNWKDVGDILNMPFGFIGSFVDVLSYIRLFAVGLSSYFIADSFNNMGGMVMDIHSALIPFAILVIAFGHILNIALAVMGVLVHGIRLNTLEFSNHMGLTWSGHEYKPLTKVNVKQ